MPAKPAGLQLERLDRACVRLIMASKASRRAAKTSGKKKKSPARSARRRPAARKGARWSQRVTEESNALDL
jgi:hypothetical protein